MVGSTAGGTIGKITAMRYHDIAAGHRVVGHEGKCRKWHGHGYRVHFHCEAEQLDEIGRVIDFSVIKSELCMWLEDNWDHRFLMWEEDPLCENVLSITESTEADGSVCFVPFNPTAENLASFLLNEVGPAQLEGTGVILTKVLIEETPKCWASAEL